MALSALRFPMVSFSVLALVTVALVLLLPLPVLWLERAAVRLAECGRVASLWRRGKEKEK